MSKTLRIAVTGHRPDKLGGYDADENFCRIRRHMLCVLEERKWEDLTIISGGALGIDQLWMEVGLYLEWPVIAAIPFKGYEARWPLSSRQKYWKLLDQCQEVRYICEDGYAAHKMQIRNQWMVDNSDLLIAYWDGSVGGTHNCIKYAEQQKRQIEIFNLEEILK